MKVIVLGGTGYLGKKVVDKLISMDITVLCIIRTLSLIDSVANSKIQYCCIDDIERFLSKDEKYDSFINMACLYHSKQETELDVFDSNLFFPINVFLKCIHYGIKRYINVGSSLPEDLNTYSYSKSLFERTMCFYAKKSNLICTNIKLEMFYGEDEPSDRFIKKTILDLLGNKRISLTKGTQKRDFIYIKDAVNSIAHLVICQPLNTYIDFSIGSGESVSIRELVIYLKNIANSSSELCFGDVPLRTNEPDTCANIVMMNEYGIYNETQWKDGMLIMVDSIRSNLIL